jgi:hypothetical protein
MTSNSISAGELLKLRAAPNLRARPDLLDAQMLPIQTAHLYRHEGDQDEQLDDIRLPPDSGFPGLPMFPFKKPSNAACCSSRRTKRQALVHRASYLELPVSDVGAVSRALWFSASGFGRNGGFDQWFNRQDTAPHPGVEKTFG